MHALALPDLQIPTEHTSPWVHRSPSSQVDPSGRSGFEHCPVFGLQTPTRWHWLFASHWTAGPLEQAPDLQASFNVQALSSLHEVPSARFVWEHTPVPGSHFPSVFHWEAAGQTTGLAPLHVPSWHVSVFVQASPSLHEVPFPFNGLEHCPVATSQVPGR